MWRRFRRTRSVYIAVLVGIASVNTDTFSQKAPAQDGQWPATEATEPTRLPAARLRPENVRIAADGAELGATLVLPAGRGPHPAIVIVSNTFADPDESMRDQLMLPAQALARNGIAALLYDRRGWHDSTGDAQEIRFDVMASDALAAIEYLAGRSDIDTKRIGLSGFSNSGWIATLAASKSDKVALVVNTVCAPVPPWRVDLSRIETMMRGDGFDDRVVARALEYAQRRFEVGRAGSGWDDLEAMKNEIRAEPWFEYLDHSDTLADLQRLWNTHLSYDPLPAWQKLKTPILVVFAEYDWNYRVEGSVTLVKESLRTADNRDHTILVIPQADHRLRAAKTGGRREFLDPARPWAPGAWDIIMAWALKRFGAAA